MQRCRGWCRGQRHARGWGLNCGGRKSTRVGAGCVIGGVATASVGADVTGLVFVLTGEEATVRIGKMTPRRAEPIPSKSAIATMSVATIPNRRRWAKSRGLSCSSRINQCSRVGNGRPISLNNNAVSATNSAALGRVCGSLAKVRLINCFRCGITACLGPSAAAASRSNTANVCSRKSS